MMNLLGDNGMFHVNDVIIYGTQGVCRIDAIEEKRISGIKKMYFVLKPAHDSGSTIYVPVDNEHVLKKMRRLLTKPEIDRLIDSMRRENVVWIEQETERKEHYKSILAQGDHLELIKMIKSIYVHKLEREAAGKRLHLSDERFFKDAEHILYNEFQYVLNLESKDALMKYIIDRIG